LGAERAARQKKAKAEARTSRSQGQGKGRAERKQWQKQAEEKEQEDIDAAAAAAAAAGAGAGAGAAIPESAVAEVAAREDQEVRGGRNASTSGPRSSSGNGGEEDGLYVETRADAEVGRLGG
jgi:hypothetical protein